jgi:acyl-CoA synthetase (AMP-forming)/AMP-acid ligase II
VPETVFDKVLGGGDGDRPFIIGDSPRSYGDLRAAAGLIADRLRAAGCRQGTRVGVCFDQGFEYAAALFGVWKAGGVSVLMSPDWTVHEKDRVLGHAEARLALADTPVLGAQKPSRALPVEGLDALLHEYPVSETESAEPGDAVLIYTSGTTGTPKGVMLTASGITANVAAVAEYLGLGPGERSPVFTPTCYAYSLSQNLSHAWAGAALFPAPSGLMFPREILLGIASHRLTGISGTPTVFRILAELDPELDVDLSSIRYAMVGGQPLNTRLVSALGSLFPRARVVNMYGCSENSPRISYHWADKDAGLDEHGYYAVGVPVRGTEIRIGPSSDGVPGGEVLISGSSLMRGYWRDPAATAERLRDGWFHTRDLGYLDPQGRLHLTGRETNIINIGNEKVSPEEVERVLLELPGIREAAVYGAPDALLGESVHARVVLDPEARLQVTQIQLHCRERVSGFKVPRRILVVDSLPKTLYGKIDRKKLREIAASSKEGNPR